MYISSSNKYVLKIFLFSGITGNINVPPVSSGKWGGDVVFKLTLLKLVTYVCCFHKLTLLKFFRPRINNTRLFFVSSTDFFTVQVYRCMCVSVCPLNV